MIKVKRLIIILSLCVVFYLIIKNNGPELSAPLPDAGARKKANNVNLDQSIKEKFPVRRVETLGALAGNGPMLISEESESGLVTKTYQLTPSKSITEVVAPNPKVPLLGSVEYEALAKQDYFESIQVETNLSELKEIFEDFPTAKQSEYLYSGIREAYVFKSRIRQLRDSDFLLSADQWKGPFEIEAISNLVERELKAQQIKDRLDEDMNRILLDKADAPERFKQRMVRLYGDFPKPIFQRLMSIDIFTEPRELIRP